jgi:hypothetical protein
MIKYKDDSGELLKIMMEEDAVLILNKEEFVNYKNFIESKISRKYFSPSNISTRISEKNNIIINLLEPMFFDRRIINFTKLKKFMLSIVEKDNLTTMEVELSEDVYMETRPDGAFSELIRTFIKFFKEKQIFEVKDKSIKIWKNSSLVVLGKTMNIPVIVPFDISFKIKDIQFLFRKRDRFMSKYMGLDEIVFAPSRFIDPNDHNKKLMLSMVKKNGLGMCLFAKGFEYTEKEVRDFMVPAVTKTRNSFLFYNKDKIFFKLILTQSKLSDDIIIDIINRLKTNKEFVEKIKSSKKIRKIYKDRAAILLFIDML